MGYDHFYIVTFQVDRGIKRSLRHIVVDKVLAAVGGLVEMDGQPGVQVRIVLEHAVYVLQFIGIILVQLRVCSVSDQGSVLLVTVGEVSLLLEFSFLKVCPLALSVSPALGVEFSGGGVHSLGSHTVKSHGLSIGVRTVFSAGVYLSHGNHEAVQRNTSAIVPDGNFLGLFIKGNVNTLSEAHVELVYGVIYDLLEKHIDTVIFLTAVSQLSQVHSRSLPQMLVPIPVLDVLTSVSLDILLFFTHR